jgi:hypothetical protein
MQEHCHTKLLATRYSLLAAVLPFATRYSPFANSLFASRYSLPFFFRLADLPISRFADNLARQEPRPPTFSSLVLRLVFKSVSKKTKPAKAGWEKLEGASPDAPKIFRQCRSTALQKTCYSPFATRHSLLQRDGLRNLPAVVTIFWLGDA